MDLCSEIRFNWQWLPGTQYLLANELSALAFSLGGLAPLTEPWRLFLKK